ncbi:MAG TPA: hypothetical protein PLJ00_05875 [Chitinophagales bacterium]|nr:hypothetical protein [Chitinophagales bacterium]
MQNFIKHNLGGDVVTDFDKEGISPKLPDGFLIDSLNTRNAGNQSYLGGRSLVKGTLSLGSPVLPTGENNCIGLFSIEGTENHVYFNANSNDVDGIYLYQQGQWEKLIEGDMNFMVKNKITKCNLVNKELLYWVDGHEYENDITGNPPRKINLTKANDIGKKRIYRLFIESDFVTEGYVHVFNIFLQNQSGVVYASHVIGYTIGAGTKREELKNLADAFNAIAGVTITATSTSGYLEIELKAFGENTMTAFLSSFTPTATPGYILLVPWNFYPNTYKEDFIDRIKYAPLVEPRVTPGTEYSFKHNYISNKYFQFATQYVYDDGETTVISPISKLAYGNTPCGVDVEDGNINCFDIDFYDDRLRDANVLAVLKRVNLLVRYGNGAEWRLVKTFEREEFDIRQHTFRFFNDGGYPVLSLDINRVEESVPLISIGQEFVSNIGYLAANKEGYDNVSIDAKAILSYEADPCADEQTGTVTGRIYIRNYVNSSGTAEWNLYQPIYRLSTATGATSHFGGAGPGGFYDTDDKFLIPNNGFIVYAAGTDYAVKSVQNAASGVTLIPGDSHVYDASSAEKKDAIISAMQAGEVYSTFTLNLPPGKYILRIASHKLSSTATGVYKYPSTGKEWQNTSTFVRKNSVGVYEATVTVTAGGTVNVDFEINDLRPILGIGDPFDSSLDWQVVSGYLADGETSGELSVLANSPRMEITSVSLSSSIPTTPTSLADLASILFTDGGSWVMINCGGGAASDIENGFGYTDHNGFFYFTRVRNGVSTPAMQFKAISNAFIALDYGNNFYSGNLDSIDSETASLVTSVTGAYEEVFLYNNNINVTQGARTHVTGFIKNSDGDPVPGAKLVCIYTNRVATTDGAGAFSLLVYSQSNFGNKRNVTLLATQFQACCAEYPFGDAFGYTVETFVVGGTYSDLIDFIVADIIVDITSNQIQETWMDMNVVRLGIVYEDHAGGRLTRVNRTEDFKVVIPAVTDPNGSHDKAVISFEVNHIPPIQARKWRLARALNPLISRWLEFIISDVKYIKSYDAATGETDDTTYAAGDATEIQVSLKPITDYISANEGVFLSFIPEDGDRILFLKDALGAYFGDLYDFEIQNHRLSDPDDEAAPFVIIFKYSPLLPQIEDGVLVRLYTPRRVIDGENELYYEFGPTYDILEPGTENRRHGCSEQNQIIGAAPAIGIAQGGDCYTRIRNMVVVGDTDQVFYKRKVKDEYLNDTDINSKQFSIGRPNYVDVDYQQRYHFARFRWDLRFKANGNKITNAHSNFNPGDYVDLDAAFGGITALVQVANTSEILAVQQFDIQPIYTEKSPIFDLNNKDSIGKSASPANLGVPFRKNIGSQHPLSIVSHQGMVFGFDLNKKLFWQYAGNDLFELSNKRNFKKLAVEICDALAGYDVKISAVVNKRHDEVIWAIERYTVDLIGGDGGPGDEEGGGVGDPGQRTTQDSYKKTIAYNFERTGLVGSFDYYVDAMAPNSDTFVSANSNTLWVHEATDICGNFHNEQFVAKVKIVFTEYPLTVKDWFAMRLSSLKKWKAEIEIPPSANIPIGMKSRLTYNRFKNDEGYFWASLLNDMTDPYKQGTELDKLFNGRSLKGSVMVVELETNSTEMVALYEVAVSVSASQETL